MMQFSFTPSARLQNYFTSNGSALDDRRLAVTVCFYCREIIGRETNGTVCVDHSCRDLSTFYRDVSF